MSTLTALSSALAAPDRSLALLRSPAGLASARLDGLSLAAGPALRVALDERARSLDPADVPGGAGRVGTLETAPVPAAAFDTAVVSWNALSPPGAWLKLEVRARAGGRWTGYYRVALWSADPGLPSTSFVGERDADGRVDTDTLVLVGPARADALQLRVTLGARPGAAGPTLTGLAAVTSDSARHRTIAVGASDRAAWGRELPVPQRSQMLYPDGGPVWCSPASVTMILEYWGARLGRPLADPVPQAARAAWDAAYGGAGNWPFNTAYASGKGLSGLVTRLSSLLEAEAYVARGVPLALSVAWAEGELDGAHLPSSNGHLVVLRGFTPGGDPVVNDPAARDDAGVRTVFGRAQLERAWVGHSGGIVYVIEPPEG